VTRRGRALEREAFLARRRTPVDRAALDAALARVLRPDGPAPLGFAADDERRWVPIGPSVVRRGLGNNRPRVTGRVRDLAVSEDGRRLYAATAKGGVWYSGDAGATWTPVGGWAERTRRTGGTNTGQSCGCLLVRFGATAADDVVLVGTGEPALRLSHSGGIVGGVGVLAATGPADAAVDEDPWEQTTGLSVLEGQGTYRLARDPAARAGAAGGADRDRVLAATTDGLYVGTRQALAENDPDEDPDAAGPGGVGYDWQRVGGYDDLLMAGWPATDVLWLPGGRIVTVAESGGCAWSDDDGATFAFVSGLDGVVEGRLSLAAAGDWVYVLGERPPGGGQPRRPTLWRFPATAATPTAVVVLGVPRTLWGGQRDYDQAIAVDVVGTDHLVYLGGSTVQPTGSSVWSASLWCFSVPAAGTGSPSLRPARGISRRGAPPAADGADRDGLIGNDVHADVHALRLAGSGGSRQLWVGCDGGVFVSAQAGRCNTFAARVTGLAALEVGYAATHPTTSGYVAAGTQDNGTLVRAGDTVWDTLLDADGGGVVIHPVQTHRVVGQYTNASWYGRPTAGYRDPMQRGVGGPSNWATIGRENRASAFYSGAAAVRTAAPAGRIALGTNRVWLTDDLGAGAANTWRVLPAPRTSGPTTAAATDPRPGGGDAAPQRGVYDQGALGPVVALRWASPTELYALYREGVVHHEQTGDRWTSTLLLPGTVAGAPSPAGVVYTDLAPVPGTTTWYLVTTGDADDSAVDTCWFCDRRGAGAFTATGLRRQLDVPGPPAVAGPRDAAYAVAVDPDDPAVVFVGTATGVWRGARDTDASGAVTHDWEPFVNGLPHATVQDLAVWSDGAGGPRLLRAAVQSRGVWEVDLAAADEPPRTYVRVHAFDDRRVLPTPLACPQRPPGGPDLPATASPDLVVRPAWPRAAAPPWQLGNGRITAANAPPYELWTFQSALRWTYPAVAATGEWTDQFGDLVQTHRAGDAGLTNGRFIDRALWEAVVGGHRLDGSGAVTADPAHPLVVHRPGWHHRQGLLDLASEVDLVELVRPPRVTGDVWQVYREPSTVEVLLHHRDTRPLDVDDAWVVLLWAHDPSPAALQALAVAGVPAYAEAAAAGTAPAAPPAGWTLAAAGGGGACHRLRVPLDARIPRAVPIDLDLSAVPAGAAVLLLAVVGSGTDADRPAPVGAPAGVGDLVRAWPYAAARLLTVVDAPVPPP
jgi:hypothetical protein